MHRSLQSFHGLKLLYFLSFRRELTEDGKWTIEDEVFISKGASPALLNATMAMLSGNTSKIFVLHATTSLTRSIFLAARKILPRENRFAWIITENAYTRNEDLLYDFPLGTKAFLVNHDVRSEELLRDTIDLVGEAIEGDQGNAKDAQVVDAITRYRRSAPEFHNSATYTFPSSTSSSSLSSPSSPSTLKTSFSSLHKPTSSPSRHFPSPLSLKSPSSSSVSSTSSAHSALRSSLLTLTQTKPKARDCWTDRAEAGPPHQDLVYR